MPQIDYRANLSSAIYPMTLAKAGRTVISPGADQNFDKRVDAPGDSTKAVGIPQAIYMENVLPTPEGYQSIGFKTVGSITAPTTSVTTVETVSLAVNSENTAVVEDVDVTDDGTHAADWTKSANVVYAGGIDPSPSGPLENSVPFWESITSNPAVGGNPTNYYEFADHRRSNSVGESNFPPRWKRDFGIGGSPDITINVDVTFLESELAIAQATADAFPEKVFIVGVANSASEVGVKVIYNTLDNTLKIAHRNSSAIEVDTTFQASAAVPALNYAEWYSLNITAVKDGADNWTITATLSNSTPTVQATVSHFYAAGSFTQGGYVILGRQSNRHSVTVAPPFTVSNTNYAKAEFILLTNAGADPTGTYASQRTGFDNLHVEAVITDPVSTIVSGVENIQIAFNADVTVTATWSRSEAEDWEGNPIASANLLTVDNTTLFSTATVRGIAYVCLREAGTTKIYQLSISDSPAVDTLLFTDITATIGETFSTTFTVDDIIGISGSFNYLLLHTATVVFWSSTTTPTDFAASLVSGAGSETPGNLKGDISFIKEHVAGFYIYTTKNVVFAAFTGNRAYPWKFREIGGSGGFNFSSQVSGDTNATQHYGLNNARFIQTLAPDSATVQSPEVTDFLERVKRWDIFTSATNTFSVFADTPGSATSLINLNEPRIWYVLDRYILLPYGVVSGQYTYCIVFDMLLQRYGKLKLTFNTITTDETNIYFVNYATLSRKKLYFDMYYADTDPAFSHEGVLVLGKFELTRGDMIQIEGVEVESTIQAGEGTFTAHLLPSLNGKNFTTPVALTRIVETTPNLARFPAHTVGQNVSLLLKGAFDLTTIQLVAQNAGRAE